MDAGKDPFGRKPWVLRVRDPKGTLDAAEPVAIMDPENDFDHGS